MKKYLGALTAVFCLCLTLCVARGEATAVLPDENELAEKTNAILNYLNLSDKDDYDVIFGIYNYICQTVEYDWPATEKTDWDGVSIGYGQTAYEAICQEKAVCAGIANAVTLLLERSGVPCRTVVGYDEWGIGHAWNLVELNGLWYFMDATKELGQLTYVRFLKSWDDLGGYSLLNNSDIDFSNYALASVSYTDKADATLDSYGDFQFNSGTGNITITAYTGLEANVIVPAEIDGRKVTRLAQYCFEDNANVRTIVISEGIEQIDSLFAAFCKNLTSISIPSTANLAADSSGAFVTGLGGFVQNCPAMEKITVAEGNPYLCVIDNVLYNKNQTTIIYYPAQNKSTVVRIPDGVQVIQDETFAQNTYLQEVILPDSVKSIGYWAFDQCSSLKKANIPPNCRGIGQYAFAGTQLTEVHIPAATQTIVSPAFSSTLQSITVDEANTDFYVVDNVLFNQYNELLTYAARKADTSYTVPAHTTAIVMYAFRNAGNLQEIILPSGLLRIEHGAFQGCRELEHIEIPDTVTYLGDSAFFDCMSLAKLTIPASVETIGGNNLLANVVGTIIFGSQGSTAHTWAIDNGYAFQDINASWDLSGTCGDSIAWTLSEDGILIISGEGAMLECDPVPWQGYASMITTVSISEGITTIADNAFYCCVNMTSISLPESLTTIGFRAFQECISLTAIHIPDGVTTIKWAAFCSCKSLPSITLPDNIQQIGTSMFQNCEALTQVTLPRSLTTIDSSAFSGCKSLKSIELPDNLISIEARAFESCTALESIELPQSLRFLNWLSFMHCSSLKTIEIPEGIYQLRGEIFSECIALTAIIIHSESIPDIATDTFAGCDAMLYCHPGSEFESWALSNGYKVAPISLIDGILPDDYLETMQVLTLPADLTVIEAEAFMNLPVQVVIVPAGCTAVGSRAFAGCADLVYISLPDGADVAEDAFEGCTNVYVDTGK